MKTKSAILFLIVAQLITACGVGTALEWKPPILPVALVFSENGVRLELDLGIQIPYLGTFTLTAPLGEIPSESPVVFVTLNGETHQYDLSGQNASKFDGIICRTGCEIAINLLPNGSIHLDIRNFDTVKNAIVLPYSGNFTTVLVVEAPNLNIRQGPDRDFEEIGGVYQGDLLKSDGTIMTSDEGSYWIRVLVPPGNYGSGREGWVNTNYVHIQE